MASGANVPAPPEDVDNENPSLVALGTNLVQEKYQNIAQTMSTIWFTKMSEVWFKKV